jgi:hypothetical protein
LQSLDALVIAPHRTLLGTALAVHPYLFRHPERVFLMNGSVLDFHEHAAIYDLVQALTLYTGIGVGRELDTFELVLLAAETDSHCITPRYWDMSLLAHANKAVGN